jgi:hypothetical protein
LSSQLSWQSNSLAKSNMLITGSPSLLSSWVCLLLDSLELCTVVNQPIQVKLAFLELPCSSWLNALLEDNLSLKRKYSWVHLLTHYTLLDSKASGECAFSLFFSQFSNKLSAPANFATEEDLKTLLQPFRTSKIIQF